MSMIKAAQRRYLAFAIASAWALVPAMAANDTGSLAQGLVKTDTLEGFDRAAGWQVMSAAQLDQVRGGFDLPDLQLKLSFGFDQAVFVNGELVARTVLTIDQLRSSVASQMEAMRTTMNPAAMTAEIQSQIAQQLAAAGIRATVAIPAETPAAEVASMPPAPLQVVASQMPDTSKVTPSSPVAGTVQPALSSEPAAPTGLGAAVPVIGVGIPVTNPPSTTPATQAGAGDTAPPLPAAYTGVVKPVPVVATSAPASTPSSTPVAAAVANPAAAVAPAAGSSTEPAASQAAPNTVVANQAGTVSPLLNNNSFNPVLVIQNGGGNIVGSSTPGNSANSPVATVVQNSLDDQRIQVLTEINASANSLEIMRSMNLGSSIREGLINSLRR
ncbi:MAG: hypothetical protein H6950_03515 [Zoogloeaceae bacterium]|nr:hypothetical protein [Zoogloeaceae bacterium]